MNRRDRPFIAAWIIFLFSELCAALIIYNLVVFDYVIWKAERVKKSSWSNHVWIMGVTMIILNGHGMVLFRLIPRVQTIISKFVHTFIHTAVLALAIYAYYVIHVFMDDNDHPHFTFKHLHTYLALLTAILYIFQWVIGIGIYLCIFVKQRGRKLFASCHNFIGICVLQLSIATACVQLQELDYEINEGQQHAEAAMVLIIIYGILINLIVLNPYMEWRLVGKL